MTSIFLPSTEASTKLASLLIVGILVGWFLTTSALGQNRVDQKFQKQLAKSSKDSRLKKGLRIATC